MCQSKAISGADFGGGPSVNGVPSVRAGVPTVSVRSRSWSNVTWSPEPWSTATSSFDATVLTPLHQQNARSHVF